MSEKAKKFIKFIWPVAAFCLLLFIVLNVAHAQGSLGDSSLRYLEGGESGLKTFRGYSETASGEDLIISGVRRMIGILKYVIGGVAMLLGIIYAAGFIFARGREEQITQQKKNFLYVFIGFVLIMLADSVSGIFSAEKATTDKLIDYQAAHDQLRDITNYLRWLFGSIIVLLTTISGVRMITASGNEEVITKEKRHLIWSGIGMLVILLANNVVNAIYVVEESTGETTAATAEAGITEIGGVIQLILVFLGPVAILFTIYAGFIYLTAFENEDRVKKAKKMIIAGVTGIVIIYSAFAIVNTLLGEKEEGRESLEQELEEFREEELQITQPIEQNP